MSNQGQETQELKDRGPQDWGPRLCPFQANLSPLFSSYIGIFPACKPPPPIKTSSRCALVSF